jgi:hypothetical protein
LRLLHSRTCRCPQLLGFGAQNLKRFERLVPLGLFAYRG